MGLLKAITNKQGVTVEYWKITGFNINPSYKYVDITLAGYLCVDYKERCLESIETRKFRIVWDKYEVYFSADLLSQAGVNPHTIGYQYIRECCPEFEGAIDSLAQDQTLVTVIFDESKTAVQEVVEAPAITTDSTGTIDMTTVKETTSETV